MPSNVSPPWYVSAFGRAYLDVYAHRDDADARRAVSCIVRMTGMKGSARVLDLCCGAGRHLRALAEQGANAVGFDLSSDLLAHARQQGCAAPLVRGDMRELPFAGGSFDAVVNLFSSFGYFADERDDERVLRDVARVLRPGGRAVFDLMNPAYVRAALQPHTVERRGIFRVESQRRIVEGQRGHARVEKHVQVEADGQPATAYTESVRLYTPSDMDAMLARAGLRCVARLGDFDGRAFDVHISPRHIVAAAL